MKLFLEKAFTSQHALALQSRQVLERAEGASMPQEMLLNERKDVFSCTVSKHGSTTLSCQRLLVWYSFNVKAHLLLWHCKALLRWAHAVFGVWGCKPESRDHIHEEDRGCHTFLRVLHPLEGTIVCLIAELLLTAWRTVPCFLRKTFRKKQLLSLFTTTTIL